MPSVIHINTLNCHKLQCSEDPRETKESKRNNSPNNIPQSQLSQTSKEEVNLFQILDSVHLILPHSASVNLMTIPTNYTREVGMRMKEAESNPDLLASNIFLVAQILADFLVTKECVSFYTECGLLDCMVRYRLGKVSPSMVCAAVMVSWSVIYLFKIWLGVFDTLKA